MSVFSPAVGIPKASFDGRQAPSMSNATWFNAGRAVPPLKSGLRLRAAEARASVENSSKARRIARRERALMAKTYLNASRKP